VTDFPVARGSSDDVQAIQRRRNVDDVGMRLSLQSVECGSAFVARDGGEPVGIAVARDSDEERYVGDLFVEPSYRGQGVGAALLEATFAESELDRAMLVDVHEGSSLALALRFGAAPREPILRFAGAIPREEELARMAAGDYRFAVETLDAAAHSYALNELDRRVRGTARPADHAEFALRASGYTLFLSGECVGYAYVWPDGRIGPLACASEGYLIQIFAYALAALVRRHSASWCTLLVPGSNRRVARAALRAGLKIEKTFTFASQGFNGDLSTYVGYHSSLF
jgi:GNAT superfamily N-acetyltransferase